MLLAVGDLGARSWLERRQASGGVDGDAEVAGEWRADVGRAFLRVDLA